MDETQIRISYQGMTQEQLTEERNLLEASTLYHSFINLVDAFFPQRHMGRSGRPTDNSHPEVRDSLIKAYSLKIKVIDSLLAPEV